MSTDEEFLNKTLNVIKSVEGNASSLGLQKGDIRSGFFLKVIRCINSFYFNYTVLLTTLLISTVKRLELPPGVNPEYHQHINNLIACLSQDKWRDNYKRNTNRNLIVDVWTNFEFCISAILRHLVEENELSVKTKAVRVLENNLMKRGKHSTIKTKIDALYTIVHYPSIRRVEADKEFLLFFAKIRNSMHNNFIYYGEDYEYVFKNTRVVFRNDKHLWFSASLDEIRFFLLDMVVELTSIFKVIITHISCSHAVIDPISETP